MKTPIEMMLDGVEWIAIEDTNRCYSEQIEPLPHITHTGLLKIGDFGVARCPTQHRSACDT